RERFLSDLTLDPPAGTGAEAAAPHLDEDYLILSTIHSAKGQEWDSVFVLSAADGCIPSDLAVGTPAEIEEQHRLGDRHVFTPRTRFIPDAIADRFARVVPQWNGDRQDPDAPAPAAPRIDVAARLRATWATPS